jgi:hypothetical protein
MSGARLPRPRNEYAPHATPAIIIRPIPIGSIDTEPRSREQREPAIAMPRPSHSSALGLAPSRTLQPIIVACTEANSTSAPTPAPTRKYASENAIAYANNANAEPKLPPEGFALFPRRNGRAGTASARRSRAARTCTTTRRSIRDRARTGTGSELPAKHTSAAAVARLVLPRGCIRRAARIRGELRGYDGVARSR